MRKTSIIGFVLLVASAVIIVPSITQGQFPPQGGGKWGKGGGGGGFGGGKKSIDPNDVFDRFYAKGRPYFLLSDLPPSSRMREPLVQYAQQKGITNGQITRQAFLEVFEQMKVARDNAAPPAGPPGGAPVAPGASPASSQTNVDMLNLWADADFRRKDRNGDGKLNADEMPDELKAALAKWDKDRDGLIDQMEYRGFFAARFLGLDQDQKASPSISSIIVEEEDWDRRPNVIRAGKLPRNGLPVWFKELDTDGDGQVALHEWRAARKPLDEFQIWDSDDDGFITPEEAMKHQAVIVKNTPNSNGDSTSTMAYNNDNGGGQMGGGRSPGGGQFGGRGPGGGGQFGGRGAGGGGQFGGRGPGGPGGPPRMGGNGDDGSAPFGGFKGNKKKRQSDQ